MNSLRKNSAGTSVSFSSRDLVLAFTLEEKAALI